MNNSNHKNHDTGDSRTTTGNPDPKDLSIASNGRRDPILEGFDDEDDYEESDRDNDYASIYTEDIIEDDEFEDLLEDSRSEQYQPEEEAVAATDLSARKSSGATVAEDNWDEPDQDESSGGSSPRWSVPDPRDEFPNEFEDDDGLEGSDDDWDDDGESYDSEARATWPLGLIAVAAIALLLLAAGGYGVVQQRSAMESEIRELQAALATAASPEDVAASRSEVTKMREQYEELRITLNSLNLENRRLRDTVSGLESQLKAQQQVAKPSAVAAAPKPAAPKPAAPKPAAVKPAPPKPAAPKPAAAKAAPTPQAAVATGWFVNFGSYSKRATAESWGTRLKPPAGNVVVTTGNKDGTVFYRVRVVNLANRDEAERVARELEKTYDLSRLWVGKQ